MIVLENEFREMMEFLFEQRWKGFQYIGYQSDQLPVNRHDFQKFVDFEDALVFWAEDGNHLIDTRSTYRAMGEGLKGNIPMVKRNGGIDVKALLIEHIRQLGKKQLLENKKREVMNDSNFDYLENQVVNTTGFKEFPSDELRTKLNKNEKDFEIKVDMEWNTHLGAGKGKANVLLKFDKSKTTDMYFFNKYEMEVLRANEKEPIKQTFYTDSHITAKEAYNLMQGRGVYKNVTNKEGKASDVWLQLDFKNTDKNGNYLLCKYGKNFFDFDKELDKYSIKELQYAQGKGKLSTYLKEGNRQKATLLYPDGKEKACFIQVNPQSRGLIIYDESQKRLKPDEIPLQPQSQGQVVEENQQSAQNTQKNAETVSEDSKQTIQGEKSQQNGKAVSKDKDGTKGENQSASKRTYKKRSMSA